jgi:hypothetical protein
LAEEAISLPEVILKESRVWMNDQTARLADEEMISMGIWTAALKKIIGSMDLREQNPDVSP